MPFSSNGTVLSLTTTSIDKVLLIVLPSGIKEGKIMFDIWWIHGEPVWNYDLFITDARRLLGIIVGLGKLGISWNKKL